MRRGDQSVRGKRGGHLPFQAAACRETGRLTPASVVAHDDESQRSPVDVARGSVVGVETLRQQIAVSAPDGDDDLVRGERRERVADRERDAPASPAAASTSSAGSASAVSAATSSGMGERPLVVRQPVEKPCFTTGTITRTIVAADDLPQRRPLVLQVLTSKIARPVERRVGASQSSRLLYPRRNDEKLRPRRIARRSRRLSSIRDRGGAAEGVMTGV